MSDYTQPALPIVYDGTYIRPNKPIYGTDGGLTLTNGALEVNGVSGETHILRTSAAGFSDNVLYIQAGNASSHATVAFLRAGETTPGTAAVGLGNSGTAYAGEYFTETNYPPAGADTVVPPNITFSQYYNTGGGGVRRHLRMTMDASAKTTTLNGWSDSVSAGPVGVFVAASGRVGVFTATLDSDADSNLTVAGRIATTGATSSVIIRSQDGAQGYQLRSLSTSEFTIYNMELGYAALTFNLSTAQVSMPGVTLTEASVGLRMPKTITAAATTGAQTINKPMGQVNFAAAATTLVVTNSLVDANSIVTAQVLGTDTTAVSVRVTKASGSFTLTLPAAATAETAVEFLVIN